MKNSLPILYARGNNGKILEWQIEVDGNKFRMITGARDAKKVASKWTICKAKNVGRANATTPEKQALSEAQSKWDKKLKAGGYWESIKDIDKSKFVEPMLANHFVDRKGKIQWPVMVDRKYNGMRQITHSQGQFTRKGEQVVSAPHILVRVSHLFDAQPDLVLDGELYNHDYRYELNEIIKLVRKTKNVSPADLKASEEKVDYYVYDGYGFTLDGVEITEETPCSQRRAALKKLLKGIKDVVVVDFEWAKDEAELMKIYQSYVDDGYEGAIVRLDGAYEHKRSNNLLKVKPEDDDEGTIVDITDGNGNWAGAAYNVTIKMKNGKQFDAVFTGPYGKRAEILKNKNQWIGKEVTYTYIGFTGLGTPNSGRINPKNCFKGDR